MENYWLLLDYYILLELVRSRRPEMFLGKGVLKICSKFTGEHPCRSLISIKLHCNFIEITFQHGCSPVNLLHISEHLFQRTPLGGCFWYSAKKLRKSSIRVENSEQSPYFLTAVTGTNIFFQINNIIGSCSSWESKSISFITNPVKRKN